MHQILCTKYYGRTLLSPINGDRHGQGHMRERGHAMWHICNVPSKFQTWKQDLLNLDSGLPYNEYGWDYESLAFNPASQAASTV